jgi:uncharacterized membrane protein
MTDDPHTGAPHVGSARGEAGWDRHPGVRSGPRLTVGERTADLVSRAAGTWIYLTLLAAAIVVAGIVGVWQDDRAGAVAILSLALSALALIEISLVLMACRRVDRNTNEAALYDLDQSRRATAVAEDLRGEVQRLHEDLSRLTAQAERSAITVHQRPPRPHPDS